MEITQLSCLSAVAERYDQVLLSHGSVIKEQIMNTCQRKQQDAEFLQNWFGVGMLLITTYSWVRTQ